MGIVKKGIIVGIIALLFPYMITLAWTGRIGGEKNLPLLISGKKVIMDARGGETYMDVEEYLPGVVARQMPAEYGREALRAQAIIARTYIYKMMNGQDEIKETQLNMEYLEERQMEKLWGSESFVTNYKLVEDAVASTKGTVITYEGQLAEPLFHRACTGRTRNGDENHPYLAAADSARDVEAEGYLAVLNFQKQDFADRISAIPDAVAVTVDQIPDTIQMVERDEGGYVGQIQIGTKIYTGDEVKQALGLPSSAFTFESYEGGIRTVCQGIGHGYGFSQYGAKCRAEDGYTGEEILSYYYKNIVLISE